MPCVMLERVRDTILAHGLLRHGEPVWVAVSGGVDSMVLLHVLRSMGHPCHVAHVDHGLRGAESDADRAFVQAHCIRLGVPFVVHRVDVKGRVSTTGESTQMAARELRLAWLKQRALADPHLVATAHHADDVIETFLIGLLQGMGAKGWGGIPVRSGAFIRPLIDVPRAEILAYARAHDITWREDASNASDAYLRNRVRHELLPLMETLRPGARKAMGRNMRLFGELGALAAEHGANATEDLRPEADGTLRIPFDRFAGTAPRLSLHHVLRGLGFHPDRADDMLKAMRMGHTGAWFPSDTADVFVDREQLVIAPRAAQERQWNIPSADAVPADAPLRIRIVPAADIDPAQGPGTAWLDADRVTFPLVLRPWRAGDRLQLGGGGTKLVSDILIDAKVPRDRKRNVHVLSDAQRVLWLCGWRIDGGSKACGTSHRILRFDWLGESAAP